MSDLRDALAAVWTGRGVGARSARALLIPAAALYRAGISVRGFLYDRGLLGTHDVSVPVLSVGNLTVGGTGKTPVAAWFAREMVNRGVTPAIVLRGYGGDEALVHRRLNEGVPVISAPDRVRGIREAVAHGVDAVVLDDAFQHRRAARDADVVLVNADSWTGTTRLLPAGPWREPLSAVRRASLVIVTRKTADRFVVADVRRAISRAAPRVPLASAYLFPRELRSTATGQTIPLQAIEGADVTAIAAVAHPEAFFRQLTELGAIVHPHPFPDHHAFTRREARALVAAAEQSDFVVCTLKDAVKLESIWPAEGGSLWYVSQHLKIEDGQLNIDRMLDDLLAPAH